MSVESQLPEDAEAGQGDTRTLVVSTYHTICRGASHIMKQPRWKKYCFAAVYSSVPDGDTFEQGVFLVIYLPQWTFVLIFQAIVVHDG